MHARLTRVIAGAAALAAASVGLFSVSATALPPGTPSSGLVSVNPGTGTATTSITLSPPAGAACQGDSATGGYRWQTFIASASVDAGTLTYAGGAGPNAVAGAVVSPLVSTGGSVITDMTTSVGTALLTGIPTFDFSAFPAGAFPSGAYNIGFACTLSNATTRFWQAPLTITNAPNFAYAFGAAPAAPVLGATLTPGNGTLAGTFTEAPSAPAVTGYTVTAVPTAGATVTLPVAAAATSFTLTGLVNGTSYSVSMIATNTVGNSAPSNAVTGTPSVAPQPPVTNLVAAPGAPGSAVLSWTAPAGSATPTGYTIGVSPTVAGAPFSAAGSPFTVTGLAAGTSYTFTVTALYAAPDSGTPATVTFIASGAQVIIQDITVVRPAGALILTQRCGVYGPLNALPAPGIPGFEAGLPAAAAAGTTGTAPTTGAAAGGPADPQFPAYPFPSPASYPTHCGVDLGTGAYLTSGTLAGQYYSANGRLNQVTVADNRDASFGGWTVNGTMSAFTNGSSTFSGDNLGWIPQVASTTAGQTVTAGAAVNPLTAAGLGSGKTLASSATAATARGIAQLDARLLLLIPVSAAAGTFTGTLTLSAV
jgi:large repetitive protein